MKRRPSFRSLAARALTAFWTVWCLGCAAYDPLIESLLGHESDGMTCGWEFGGPAPVSGDAAVSASPASGENGSGCQCTSCCSVRPQLAATASGDHPSMDVIRLRAAELLSVSRAPVAPPPEFATF